jgi:hypothetical protein
MALSQDQTARLLISKHLLGRAAELLTKRAELVVAESVLALHDASDIIMHVIYEVHQIKAPTNFLDFWKAAESIHNKPVPGHAQMRRLNDLRVGLKHRGTIPNPNVVRALDPEVRAFCSTICHLYLGVNFSDLSYSDLVSVEQAKQHLKLAEIKYAAGGTADALTELVNAFDAAWKEGEESGTLFTQGLTFSGTKQKGSVVPTSDQSMIRAINLALLAVDLADYSLYIKLTPTVTRTLTGKAQVTWHHKPAATQEQFALLVEFVTNVALKISRQLPEKQGI